MDICIHEKVEWLVLSLKPFFIWLNKLCATHADYNYIRGSCSTKTEKKKIFADYSV